MRKSLIYIGPDSSQLYWLDLRKEKQLFSKGLFGGGSVMVWRASSASGKADLVVMRRETKLCLIYPYVEKSIFPVMNHVNTNNTIF